MRGFGGPIKVQLWVGGAHEALVLGTVFRREEAVWNLFGSTEQPLLN